MSRKGNCCGDAMMESFWATLKAECFADGRPATRQAARLQIFDCVEGFYNRRRLHSSLGYQSPLAFEANLRYDRNQPSTKTTAVQSAFLKKGHDGGQSAVSVVT